MPHLILPDGLPLHYVESGEGPTIVLVPGWTITTAFWQRQIDDLARDHRVVAIDLRGAGESGKTPEHHTLRDYARDVSTLVENLDLHDVTLVAWALAVSVSANLLAHGNARVGRFVWVDHSPSFFATSEWPYGLYGNFSPQSLDGALDELRNDRPVATRELLRSMFASDLTEPELDWMYAEVMKTPTEVAIGMLRAVAESDLRPLVPLLELPVLVVAGRRSIVPCAVADWLVEHLPNGRATLLEEAGHAPFWDDAPGFNAAVRGFIA